ncbi:MAG: MarR family transcriptional regulator [Burkholderiaceae bacterium]
MKPIGGGKRRTPVALQAVADGRLRLPGASVVPTGAACTALDVLEQLRVVVRLASAHSARLERATGVPGTQLWALHEVAAHDGLKVGELAQRLRLHQTTMSNLLRRLESRGLVRKGRSPHDGRIVHIHLTPAGRKTLKSSPGPARGLLPNVLDIMSAAELRKVHRGLAVLLEHMGGFDPTLAHRPLPFNE